MDSIDKLYSNYELLSKSTEDINKYENEYKEIINAAKGTNQEKKLASQFIPIFFKHFPNLAEEAINEQLNLCEEADTTIRMQAIKHLPNFCKHNEKFFQKIANVLAQLLESYSTTEQILVQNSLMELLKMDAKTTLQEMFAIILNGEDAVRDRAINFVGNKVKNMGPDILTREIEELLLAECKKVLQDVTGDEFILLMSMLTSLKISKLVPGQLAIVEMVADQADLDKPFLIADMDSLDRLLTSVKQILPHFSKFVTSQRFIDYICQNILPHLAEIPKQDKTDPSLELLKILAEMVPHVVEKPNLEENLEAIFKTLLTYLPLPPQENVDSTLEEETNISFTHVECLLFSFHQMTKLKPTFLTADADSNRPRDLKFRLQYLALKLQGYIKKLKLSLKDKKASELTTEEKVKLIALRTTTNINSMIKDLFHNPPTYKVNFVLSWKEQPVKMTLVETERPAAVKRPYDDTERYNSAAKRNPKGDRQIYVPPSGKFSTKFQMTDLPRRGRGRGNGRGFRGGYRGGRGWRH